MRLLLELPKREERAEGAIFNPFISKGGKKKCFLYGTGTRGARRAGQFEVPAAHGPT